MDYKKYHEEYLSNLNGTTAWETYLLILPSFFEIFLSSTLFTYLKNCLKVSNLKIQFVLDYFIIIFPMILRITIIENYKAFFTATLIITIFVLYKISKIDLYTKRFKDVPGTKRHFVTCFRSIINIITAVAILAVDFKIFPQRYAKTEKYGYSLMDIGVGLFVYANGVVAPEIYKTESLYKSFLSTGPLWILGSARFLIIQEIDYHIHVSEYGVHWNFFITLAVTKIISSIILYIVNIDYSLFIAMIVLSIHECLLQTGLADWILSDLARTNFLSANREGIVSSLGYVGLYFFSVSFGKYMKRGDLKQNVQLLIYTSVSSVIFLLATVNLEHFYGVSRRLANSGYCMWIMFIGISMTFLFILGEMFMEYLYYRMHLPDHIFAPSICEAVNYNQLPFFLLANILTGIVNMLFQTLYIAPLYGIVILNVYMFVICVIMYVLYVNNIKIKFW